ncbi:vacuole protein [Ceratobasidium sp. AG-Ba]|nr:vacuole protein [Ceratobasidium sp. AG-Ba]QRW01566.1 vacuole protein [Ceratobasidium sp. AG-Ba]
MASTSDSPARTPFAALPLSRFYAVSETSVSSAKKPFTPGSASLKRRLSPATFASPCKKRATDSKPSTPGEFAAPRLPRVVSKCLFEDVEMDAGDSGFASTSGMKLNYDPLPAGSSSPGRLIASPILGNSPSTSSATPKGRRPDTLVLAPSPEIVSGASNRGPTVCTSRWISSRAREPDMHHPGFDIYCDPIGYDASAPDSPMTWDEEPVPDLVFDSPKENDAPARKVKHMPPPLSFSRDGHSSSPASSTPKRPSRLATSTSVESPWSRMQIQDLSVDN